jgi:hypothetical protein
MRQCLFLTSLVFSVLAPRPPDAPGFGSQQRLGKDRGASWLRLAPGARCLEGQAGKLVLSGVWGRGVGRRWRVPKFSVLEGGVALCVQGKKGDWFVRVGKSVLRGLL